MKKVLIVKPLIPKYDLEFYRELAKDKNFDIHVSADIKTKDQLNLKTYDKESFSVYHTDIKKIGPFICTLKIIKLIKEINPDLIIFGSNPRELSLILNLLICKVFYKYKVATWSMFHRIGGSKPYSSLFYKLTGSISHRIMTYSNTGKVYQIARGINPDKIDVIGTAIDEKEIFSVKKISNINIQNEFIKEHSLENKTILLQVLRLNKIKKPHLLIEMMEELVIIDKNFVLVLIGGGELEDEIKLFVKEKKLEEYVKFIGPLYDEIKLSAWFSLSDIFVIPTCIGLSAHHSFAYGLPIVTDNSLKNQASEFDILADGLNCLLYEENNIKSFVEKILELKSDKELYKMISSNALSSVYKVNTLERKVKNFTLSVNKILG